MASIIRRPGFDPRVVPQGPVELDRSHPLGRGVVGLILTGANNREIITGASGTPSGVSVAASARGAATNFPNAGNISYASTPALAPLGDITIAAWVNPADYSNYRGVVGKNVGSNPAPFDVYLNITTGFINIWRGDGGSNRTNFVATSAPPAGNWQHIIVQVNAAQTVGTFYSNGQPAGSGGPLLLSAA